MARDFAKKFYASARWQRCRKAYGDSVFWVCERCRRQGTIVHHKKHLTPYNIDDSNLACGFDNLQLLCIDCHNALHGSANVLQNNLYFNERGDIVERPPVER